MALELPLDPDLAGPLAEELLGPVDWSIEAVAGLHLHSRFRREQCPQMGRISLHRTFLRLYMPPLTPSQDDRVLQPRRHIKDSSHTYKSYSHSWIEPS